LKTLRFQGLSLARIGSPALPIRANFDPFLPVFAYLVWHILGTGWARPNRQPAVIQGFAVRLKKHVWARDDCFRNSCAPDAMDCR
jgi:hypothetical protein